MTGATQAEKVRLWEGTVRTVLARALVLPAALALVELGARVQLAVVAGQSLFAATAAADPQPALVRTALVESILRVYTDAFARLRAREPVLHRSLCALAALARATAQRFLDAHPLACALPYADAAAALAELHRAMDDRVLARAAALMCPDRCTPANAASSSPPQSAPSADLDLTGDAALAEFLDEDNSQVAEADATETGEGEGEVADTVCDLLEMFARAATQDACFEGVYRAHSEALWRALLADMRALFAAGPGEPPIALSVPKLAMRLAPLLDAFAAQQTTLEAVAARGRASVAFEEYLFAVFLQQQPT